MEQSSLLRQLPQVDRLLAQAGLAAFPHDAAAAVCRTMLEELRRRILVGECTAVPSAEELAAQAARLLEQQAHPHFRPVLNATGVVLHTNLGRAPLPQAALQTTLSSSAGYSNLEYDLEKGERGSRYDHVTALLCSLTGAEDAMVVNNNAAAVLLMLSALAKGGEVVLSRGELVEIGGSFRVPEVMEQSGARLREVGTTNKTHLSDYRGAVDEETRALLKVHTSNYRIVGFTQSVPLGELAALGWEMGLPVLCDLGSGLLYPLSVPVQKQEELSPSSGTGILPEPTVLECLRDGADLVTFSGDKLLGGPQAGILVGRADLIAACKRHPLARALRVDKLTLAALEATLRLYRQPEEAVRQIPVLRMLSCGPEELHSRAQTLLDLLTAQAPACALTLCPTEDLVGGGSAPGISLPGWAVAVRPAHGTVEELEKQLRCGGTSGETLPLVGRIHLGWLLLCLRTLAPEELPLAAETVVQALRALPGRD